MLLFYFATQHSPLFKESKMKPRNQILQQGQTNKRTQQQATTVIQKKQKVKIKQKLKTHQKIQNYTNSALSCGGHQCAEPETCRKKEHASTNARDPADARQPIPVPLRQHGQPGGGVHSSSGAGRQQIDQKPRNDTSRHSEGARAHTGKPNHTERLPNHPHLQPLHSSTEQNTAMKLLAHNL